jgi:hypothetical protein
MNHIVIYGGCDMPKSWLEVEQSEEYNSLAPEQKIAAKSEYWDTVVTQKPQFMDLTDEEKTLAQQEFFGGQISSRRKLEPIGDILKRNFKDAIKETGAHAANIANTALLGAPQFVAQKFFGKDFFDESWIESDADRFASSALGFTVGAPQKIVQGAMKVGKAIKGAGLGAKVARGAITGAGAGVGMGIPDPKEYSTLGESFSEMGRRVGGSAALGGTIPLVGAGVKNIAQGVKKVWNYAAPDFIKSQLLPKAYSVYTKNLQKWGKGIQKFAMEKLKMPESAVKTVERKGIDSVIATRERLNDSIDDIYLRIQQGFENKNAEASLAYKKAMSGISGRGNNIPVTNTTKTMGKVLRKYGFIDSRGNLSRYADDPSLQNNVYRKMLDVYKRLGLRTKGGAVKINKAQYKLLRDNLNDLYREKPSDIDLAKVMESFYDDGERAGFTGLKKARRLFRESREMTDKFMSKSLIKERKLSNFHKLTGEEKRTIDDISKYIDDADLLSDLEDLTAAQYLDKLSEYNIAKFANDLQSAVEPKNTNFLKAQYADIFGDKTDDIFRHVVNHRKAIIGKKALGTAALITGGIAASKSGLRRAMYRDY